MPHSTQYRSFRRRPRHLDLLRSWCSFKSIRLRVPHWWLTGEYFVTWSTLFSGVPDCSCGIQQPRGWRVQSRHRGADFGRSADRAAEKCDGGFCQPAQRLLACAGCLRTHNISTDSFTATTSTWRRLSTAAGSPRSEPSSQTWLTCSECRRQSWASCLSIRNMVWRWRASLLPEMVRQVHKSTFGRLRMVRWCSPLRLGNLLQCRVLVVHVMLY